MPSFDTLWAQYPRDGSLEAKCVLDRGKPFDDYCAIKLSECLIRSGVPLHDFRGRKCWSHAGEKHTLLAQELANHLLISLPAGFGKMEKVPPADFQDKLKGRNGVVFFKDYWRRGSGSAKESEGNRSGDHIDLWKGNQITSSGMIRRSIAEFFGLVSDLNQSREVWFWEIK